MKLSRLISSMLFATILMGGTVIVPAPFIAHAQQPCDGLDENGNPCPVQDVGNPAGANPITATQTGGGSGSGINGDPSKTFGWLLGGIMTLFASLTGYAGILLNDAVYYTVLTMGTYVHSLNAVGVVWHIMRDLGNIVLIFGFLAIGVCTILGVQWYGGGTKMLPMLLLAAVFLNFSLFISEAVIDVGNIFATQFYTQINGGKAVTLQEISFGQVQNNGISNIIMNSLGLQALYNLNTQKQANGQPVVTDSKLMLIGFLGIILFIIAAFVMFSLTFILVARFVILLFLIIVAPIGFAGLAVPKLEGIAKQWWDKLIEQTITAPVLLLMLYVALNVINDACFLGGNVCKNPGNGFGANASAYTALASDQSGQSIAGFAGILLSFVVAMGLLLACTILAKRMSAFGAGWATKTAGAMSFGAIAWGTRNTVGWGLNAGARGFRKTRLASVPILGRSIAGALDRGAKASFDIRGTKALKNLPFGGLDAGEAQKGGFRKVEEERIKAREEYGKSLKQTSPDRQREKDAKDAKATKEAEHKANLSATEARHRAEREPLDEEITRARRRVADARTTGDKAGIAREETSLNNSMRQLEELRKKQSDFRQSLESAHEGEIAILNGQIKAAQVAPQLRYAKGLRLWTDKDNTFNRWVNLHSNTESARRIEEFASKSKSERDQEALLAAMKDAATKLGTSGGGSGSGGAPASATIH